MDYSDLKIWNSRNPSSLVWYGVENCSGSRDYARELCKGSISMSFGGWQGLEPAIPVDYKPGLQVERVIHQYNGNTPVFSRFPNIVSSPSPRFSKDNDSP